MIECDCQAVSLASFLGGMVTTVLLILWYGTRRK